MKKITSIILSAIMIITLSACGKEQTDNEEVKTTLPVTEEAVPETKTTLPVTEEDVKDDNPNDLFFDEADYTVEQKEPVTYPDSYSITKTYTLKNKPEATLPVEINLDSEKITLNSTKVSDLTSIGWTLTNNKADSTVKSKQKTNSVICNPNEKKAMIYAANLTADTINFNDCTIWDIDIDYNDNIYYDGSTEATDFNYAEGITSASSLSDIVNKLGKPHTITIVESFVNDKVQYSKISIIYDVRKNINVSFTFRSEDDTSNMISASFKYNQF